jgi:putative ABC transport system permease protein
VPERLRPARLRLTDIVRVAGAGLRARPVRALLSATGIAIGIAAMVAVVGVSTSSRAELDHTLRQLGTNLLTVGPGESFFGEAAPLPKEAVAMVARIGPVESASATAVLEASVYRTDRIPKAENGSIAVLATRTDLFATVGAEMKRGSWLTEAGSGYPIVILGAATATKLGVRAPGLRVWIGQEWFSVGGILEPVALAPELDQAALVGWRIAEQHLGFDGHPTTVYTRTAEDQVEAVRAVLAATANPAAPHEVRVSRPSDALVAQRATDRTFSGLLLGLGAVALLVGGIGVANTMVMAVLERRAEIGLRRSLGATRGQIRTQFLVESLLLSALGGVGGAVIGIALTTAYASTQHWTSVVPPSAVLASVGGTLGVGVIAGLYPAIRASRLSPTEALTAP